VKGQGLGDLKKSLVTGANEAKLRMNVFRDSFSIFNLAPLRLCGKKSESGKDVFPPRRKDAKVRNKKGARFTVPLFVATSLLQSASDAPPVRRAID
jgi:hypothetical protein